LGFFFFFFPSSSSFLTCFFSVSDDSLDLAAAAFYFSLLPNLHRVYKNVPRCVIVSVCIFKLISPLVEKKYICGKIITYIYFFFDSKTFAAFLTEFDRS
jgi:hypothetical protein